MRDPDSSRPVTAGRSRDVVGADASPGAPNEARVEHYRSSVDHWLRARQHIVRGVASAARAGRRPAPLLIDSAKGVTLIDADGNGYVDYVMAFGPALLGHAPDRAVKAVEAQLRKGWLFGSSHDGELALAERVLVALPGMDRVAFAGSGSDAIALAVRIARASTGRQTVLKFEGHYHGWLDPVYVNVPGVQPHDGPLPVPVVHGTEGLAPPSGVLVCPWNDPAALDQILDAHGDEIALVLMEAVPCNFGAFEADPGYLAHVRMRCDDYGCVLAFDEVITGFRLARGGAQELAGVTPDLTILAKALGAGLPIGMVAGRREVMAVAHDGPVKVQGTTNGSAVSVAAAVAVLDEITDRGLDLYRELDRLAALLAEGLDAAARGCGAPLVINRVGSVLQLLWDPLAPARTYANVWSAEPAPVADLAAGLLSRGVHALERGLWFVSAAHQERDIERTVDAASVVLAQVATVHPPTSF